jgi:hypothetical protein
MSVVAIVSVIIAVILAASRWLETAKPLWNLAPPKARVWIPVLALVLPQIAEKAVDTKTPVDLVNLALLSAALLVPGAKARDQDGNGIPDDEES